MSATDTPRGRVPDRGVPDGKTPDKAEPVLPRRQESEVERLQKDNKELNDRITSMDAAQKKQAEEIATLKTQLAAFPRREGDRVVYPDCEPYQQHAPHACACGYEFINPKDGRRIRRIFNECKKNYKYTPCKAEPPYEGKVRTMYTREQGMHWQVYEGGRWRFQQHAVDENGYSLTSLSAIQEAQASRRSKHGDAAAERAARSRALSQLIHDSHRQGQAMVRRKSEVYNAGLAYGVDWSQPRGTPNPEFGGHLDRMNARGGVTYPYGVDRFAQGPAAPLTGRRRQGGESWMDFGPQSDPVEQAKIDQDIVTKLKAKFDGMLEKFNGYKNTFGDTPAYKQMQEWLDVYKITMHTEKPMFPGKSESAFLKQFQTLLESYNKSSQVRKSLDEKAKENSNHTPYYLELNNLGEVKDLIITVKPIQADGKPGSGVTYWPNKRELIDDKMSVKKQRDFNISFEHDNFYLEGYRSGEEGQKTPQGINVRFGKKAGLFEVRVKCTQVGKSYEERHLISVDANGNAKEVKDGPPPSANDAPKFRRKGPPRFKKAPEDFKRSPNANEQSGIA